MQRWCCVGAISATAATVSAAAVVMRWPCGPGTEGGVSASGVRSRCVPSSIDIALVRLRRMRVKDWASTADLVAARGAEGGHVGLAQAHALGQLRARCVTGRITIAHSSAG